MKDANLFPNVILKPYLLIIGYVERIGQPIIALYNKEKIIDILVNTNGMEREDAEEHYEFNILGSYVGETTPAFAYLFDDLNAK